MTSSTSSPVCTSTCAIAIYWRAKPGQFDAYTQYLRDEVEPIDELALERGVLIRHCTLIDARPGAPWTHMRLFEFSDAAQRARLHAGMAAIMQERIPEAAVRAERAQRAALMRDKVEEVELDLLG